MTKPTKPVISQSPVPPPQRGEPRAIFATKANNYILWQINALYPYNAATVDYMDAAMDYTGLQVDEAQAQVALAAAQVQLAADQVDLAADQVLLATDQALLAEEYAQIAASAANYKGVWDQLTGPLNKPASVFWDGYYWLLNNDLIDIALSEPSDSNTDWQKFILTTKTTEPTLSSLVVTMNEYDTTSITITDYSTLLSYVIVNNDPDKILVSHTGGTISIEALETEQDQTASFSVQAKADGLEISEPVFVSVSIIDIPIIADDAIQDVDFSGIDLVNDGFDLV